MGTVSYICTSCSTPVSVDTEVCPACGAPTPSRAPPPFADDSEAGVRAALADRYRVERAVGMGGMATVYLATDLRHRRKVAVKVLRPELTAILGADRFLREIEIVSQLQHPNILTLIDSGEADGLLYYVMPYVEGESLRQKLMRERKLEIGEAVRILRDVVDALAYAHERGIVHRDIKPDNVLLTGRHALVVDFGVAKAMDQATGAAGLTPPGAWIGTPAYMAPEVLEGDACVGHRADIYSLGVMAYEILSGQRRLVGDRSPSPEEVCRDVPAPLAMLVARCLERCPADRWHDTAELLWRLEAVASPGQEPR